VRDAPSVAENDTLDTDPLTGDSRDVLVPVSDEPTESRTLYARIPSLYRTSAQRKRIIRMTFPSTETLSNAVVIFLYLHCLLSRLTG
jgi:hypothetical protein